MHRRKRISPIVLTIGIIVILVTAFILLGKLDFPGRVFRAIASIVPTSHHAPPQDESEEDLRARIRQLEGENTVLRESLLQYQGEGQIEGIQAGLGFPVLPAVVIYRDHARLFDTAIINVGTSDGVEANMPVVDSSGLVGRVVATRGAVSRILLITSPDCSFGVRDVRSRELGVVQGSKSVSWWVDRDAESGTVSPAPDLLELTYLSPSVEIRVQDLLITSGLSGITPPGIRVGEVATIISHEEQGRFEIHVRPFSDIEHLESVGVVLYKEEEQFELEELINEEGGTVGPPTG
jgi:rod shape-determining protein MreC